MSEDPPEAFAPIGDYPSLGRAQEHALVILAMDLPCWLGSGGDGGGYVLLAEPERGAAIADELRAYDEEQREIAERPTVEIPNFGAAPWWAFGWCVVLLSLIHI